MTHPKVLNVNIKVFAHKKWGQSLIANLIVDFPLTSKDVRNWCRGKISSYKIPHEINISNKVTH